MSPNSPIFFLATMLAIIVVAQYGLNKIPVREGGGRYESLDGLRGYLAVFVFIHHSRYWFSFLRTGKWEIDSNFYVNLGTGSVALFFMITAFLFFSKLLDASENAKEIDWAKLYLGRVTRLVPMYCAAVGVALVVGFCLIGFHLQEPVGEVLGEVGRWFTFGVGGMPDLNGLSKSGLLAAGVFWSLAYEWMFYLALPILSLTIFGYQFIVQKAEIRATYRPLILLLTVPFAALLFLHLDRSWSMVFLGGILASLLHRQPSWCKFAVTPLASVIALAALAVVATQFQLVHAVKPAALYTLAFCIISGGNTLFGALVQPFAKRLGEISYSIYLMHGIVLSTTFWVILGPLASEFSLYEHWLVILVATPVLLVMCMFSYITIEKPGMELFRRAERKSGS